MFGGWHVLLTEVVSCTYACGEMVETIRNARDEIMHSKAKMMIATVAQTIVLATVSSSYQLV